MYAYRFDAGLGCGGCFLGLGLVVLLLGTPVLWLIGLTLRPGGHGAWALGAVGLVMAVGIFIMKKIYLAFDRRRYLSGLSPDDAQKLRESQAAYDEVRAHEISAAAQRAQDRKQENEVAEAARQVVSEESRQRYRAAAMERRHEQGDFSQEKLSAVGVKLEGGGIACPRCNGTTWRVKRRAGNKGVAITSAVVLSPLGGCGDSDRHEYDHSPVRDLFRQLPQGLATRLCLEAQDKPPPPSLSNEAQPGTLHARVQG